MAAQSTAEASKKEVDFHVESRRLSERTLPYQPISWSEKAQSALRQQSAFDLTYLSVIYPSYYPHHRRFHQSEQHNNSPPPPQSTNARQ
jgi:hypothetical protein